MDYKEKYERSLERAKKLHETCDSQAVVGWCEYIFPELKESKDERIRKALIENFKWYCGDFLETTKWGKDDNLLVKDIIAWLEKQDSQILANSCETCKDEQKLFDYESVNIQQKDFAPKADMPRYSIGDVLCDKSCTMLNKESQSNFEITDIRNGMYICDKCSFPISQQDEYELVAKRIEQKPAWSEEDNKHYESCLNYFEEIKPDSVFYKDYLWLKSLKERINV